MKLYLDTSAWVKRFLGEPGALRLQKLFDAASEVSSSRVTEAEALSAIARRTPAHPLSSGERDELFERVRADLQHIGLIDTTREMTGRCERLFTRYPLRGFDAVHLATAWLLEDETAAGWRVVSADRRLLEAAKADGFRVLDPAAVEPE